MAKKKAKRAPKRPKANKAKKAKKAKKAARGAPVSPKQQFLQRYGVEHATTLRVLRALPPGQGDFRPHPRSQSAGELVYTMLFEQELSRRALAGGPIMGGGGPPEKPVNFEAGIAAFDMGYQAIVDQIKKASDSNLQRVVQFPVAKGQMGEWPALDFIWFMLFDHIHHRGQMSVYVRMAGGKVPSIYGPSGDDPWS